MSAAQEGSSNGSRGGPKEEHGDAAAELTADDLALDEALEAIATGDMEQALGHLEDVDPELVERWTTASHALLELGDQPGAENALQRATELGGDEHADVLWARGRLRLAQWRLDEARVAFERLNACEEGAPLLENLALLAELGGDARRADALYRRATALDPEGSPPAARLSPQRFEKLVAQAAEELPPQFREALEEVAVVIDPMPTAKVVGAPESGHPPEILGLFTGTPLGERSAMNAPELPPTIFLFQRNLERTTRSLDELRDEIRTTLYHELAHALGFDEEGVDELGLA